MRKVAFLLILALAFCLPGFAAASGTNWQVRYVSEGPAKTVTWRSTGSRLWIKTKSGRREIRLASSYLDMLRDQVSELSMTGRTPNALKAPASCASYAEFRSVLGSWKICEPALHADSKAITLLSRLRSLR